VKRTKTTDETQEKNGFGRVPDALDPKLAKLSHLEAHVFLMLTISAVRKPTDPRLGCVDISKSELARKMGIDRTSLRRATRRLFDLGLLDPGGSSCPKGWGIMTHYLGHHDSGGGSSGPVASPQPQPSIEGYAAPIRSEDEVKTKVKTGARKARKKPARKSAPPHVLQKIVAWDKERREVRITASGRRALQRSLTRLEADERLEHSLTEAEMQEGWGRLNGHLMGNPFKTNPKTLPAIVLNWFETDLRRKNNHPQRGKPLAQRIDDKAKERMAPDGHTPNSEGRTDDNLKRLEIRNFRLNS
jgi:DNA-binding MarR family transcriptional regulator